MVQQFVIFATMLVQTAPIQGLKRSDYDDLLAKGWFRGNGIVYRSEVVCIDSMVYGIRNIRFPVSTFSMRKSHRRLFAKNNPRFSLRIGTPQSDSRREELYKGAIPRFKAFVHGSLEEVLLSPSVGAEFDTLEISLYEGNKLIAVSYVDIGDKSMASILCLYDQSYKKQSLGIYTMLIELELAKKMALEYYYPGYVLDQPSSFDYKLTLGPCEWLNGDRHWTKNASLAELSKGSWIRRKMNELEQLLNSNGYDNTFRVYPYYTLGHLLLERPDLIRVPAYFVINTQAVQLAVSYDLQMDSFLCFDLKPVSDLDFLHRLKFSNDYLSGPNYQLEPLCCSFFHQLRQDSFSSDLHHIIQMVSHASVVVQ
jgi:arginine-tRNA-protein transferase